MYKFLYVCNVLSNMSQIKIILCFVLAAVSSELFAQVNFFTNETEDSLATNFYKRDKKLTALIVGNVPSLQFGAACFIHNADNRASYYLEAKSNFNRRYILEGEECNGEGVREKEVAYTTTSYNIGIGRGFTRNWFIYGGVGVVVKHTHYENEVEDNYRYWVTNDGVWFNIVGGAMYVTDKNFSILAGMDLYDRSVTLGFGYTW